MQIEKIPKLEDFDAHNTENFVWDDEVIHITESYDKEKKPDRFPTGYKIFDDAMRGGLKDGDLVIISGVSGEGKTTLAQSMTYNLCKIGVPCLWFSYECTTEHLDNKFKSMGIDPFYSVYTPKRNTWGRLEWVYYKIKEGATKFGTKAVFIDHIDFLSPKDAKTSDSEAISFKKITTELKQISMELKITTFLMAHLKKIPDDKDPGMQDIGYSAGIFQLADYVFIIRREKESAGKKFFYADSAGDVYKNTSIVKIVKNRETGENKYVRCMKYNERLVEETYAEPDPLIQRAL